MCCVFLLVRNGFVRKMRSPLLSFLVAMGDAIEEIERSWFSKKKMPRFLQLQLSKVRI